MMKWVQLSEFIENGFLIFRDVFSSVGPSAVGRFGPDKSVGSTIWVCQLQAMFIRVFITLRCIQAPFLEWKLQK